MPQDVTVRGQQGCRADVSAQWRGAEDGQASRQVVYRSVVTVQGDALGSGITWYFLGGQVPGR